MNYAPRLPDHPDLFPETIKDRSSAIGTLVRLDREIDRIKGCHSNVAVISPGTPTNADAWNWIDNHDSEHDKWIDRAHRIRNAHARLR